MQILILPYHTSVSFSTNEKSPPPEGEGPLLFRSDHLMSFQVHPTWHDDGTITVMLVRINTIILVLLQILATKLFSNMLLRKNRHLPYCNLTLVVHTVLLILCFSQFVANDLTCSRFEKL